MSKELPALRAKEVVRILEKAGYASWRQKGSHLTLHRETDRHSLTIPIHFKKTLPKGTLHAIIKQAGLTVDEFDRLRKS